MPARRHVSALDTPRVIAPELVEIGDLVAVTFKESRGIVMSKRGRVAKRTEHGSLRSYLTAEGAIIFTSEPGRPMQVTITLIDRTPVEGETLFDVAV